MILIDPYRFATGGANGYASLVSAASPTIWWRLGETSGITAADSGSAGISGTLASTATFATAGIAAASGYAGVGRGIDMAVSGAVQIAASTTPSGAALNALGGSGTSTSSWTIVLVVAGGAGSCYLASRSTNAMAIIHNFVSGKVEFFAGGYTGTDPRTGSQIDLSAVDTTTPHQIAYRYDNGNWCGILDGVEVFNVSRSFALNTTASFQLASAGGSSNPADRKYWDFQAYNRAVSTADLLAMWNARDT